MTKKEILEEIERLKAEVEKIKDNEQDNIYLLSTEEYEKYRDKIPHTNTWWWLRSPGSFSDDAASVSSGGSVDYDGCSVDCDSNAIRPALRYSELKGSAIDSKDTDCFIWNEVKWIIIDKDKEIAISVLPISFDKFDNRSNDYENSYIRKWLLDWMNN